MTRNNFLVIGILLLTSCGKEQQERAVSYYKNGQLKHEVPLINGKPEGLGIVYFKNGTVQSKTIWKDGKKDGKSVIYYESGKLRQENEYKQDICRMTKDFTEDGFLRKIRIYDSLERLIDFFVYKKDGTRDFGRQTKDPIFITETDTVSVGETFSAEVKLGNRQFGNVNVIIGDINDHYMAVNNRPLPKKDSITSLLSIKADSPGMKKISGIVIEKGRRSDSLVVIPFVYPLFVKDTLGSDSNQ